MRTRRESRDEEWGLKGRKQLKSRGKMQFGDKPVKVLMSLQVFYTEVGDHREHKRIQKK